MAVRPGEQDAELVGNAHELVLGFDALRPGLAVARARDERGAHTLGRALAQQLEVGGRWRAHEHQVGLAGWEVVDVGHRVDAEHRRAFEVRGEHLPGVARGQEVVQRHEPEFAGMRGRAGDDHALRVEQRGKSRFMRSARRVRRPQRARRRRRSTG